MEHFYQTIPGWFDFERIYRDAVEEAPADVPSTFVELGAYKGKSTAFMAVEIINSGKPINFYVVDHWLGSDEPEHDRDPDVKNGTLFSAFCRNMLDGGVLDHLKIIRAKTFDVAQIFCDVDFVFIDASHDYVDVHSDIEDYKYALMDGGVLAGHDYGWPGVRKAVDELLPGAEIINGSWRVRVSGS